MDFSWPNIWLVATQRINLNSQCYAIYLIPFIRDRWYAKNFVSVWLFRFNEASMIHSMTLTRTIFIIQWSIILIPSHWIYFFIIWFTISISFLVLMLVWLLSALASNGFDTSDIDTTKVLTNKYWYYITYIYLYCKWCRTNKISVLFIKKMQFGHCVSLVCVLATKLRTMCYVHRIKLRN